MAAQIQDDDIIVVQCEIGWFARSRSHRLAAVGKTQDGAFRQLQGVLDTMSKLSAVRIKAALVGGSR